MCGTVVPWVYGWMEQCHCKIDFNHWTKKALWYSHAQSIFLLRNTVLDSGASEGKFTCSIQLMHMHLVQHSFQLKNDDYYSGIHV